MGLVDIIDRSGVRGADRRRSARAAVRLRVRCRRVGGTGPSTAQAVEATDLSRGGISVDAPTWVRRDDVLDVDMGDLAVRGVVVGVSNGPSPGARQAHIAFTGITPNILRQLDLLTGVSFPPG